MEEKHILIVDDDAITRHLLQGFLKKESKYIIDTAKSGRDCIEYIEKNDVDLIISDVEMDDINGLEMSQILLSKEDTSKKPVILISIRDEHEIRKQSRYFKNVKKVVQKPYDRDVLLSDLKEIFDA